ncbi:hypothetical protein AYO37_00490 [Opitutia bacterium SCGC AG-212-L18]|nr:hypothetical protein AYO37_00490 [Opitutae bacterium SCGC AG-212-L18]
MEYEEIKSYLYNLIHYGPSYGIDRMRLLTESLGNPEKKIPLIHVAGTNGKGSVCAMLAAIYQKNNYRTGLFTSPHLVRLEERIQINRKAIPKNTFIDYIKKIKQIIEGSFYKTQALQPSFFEILNAAAFLYFAENNVDLAIIETGLGGRFDSTNIITPLVSIITSISHDHTEVLGDSLESITLAKAGIIKPGIPVVIGPMPLEAENIIKNIAHEQNAPLFSVEEAYGTDLNDYPTSSLHGRFQRKNAATAALTTHILKKTFPINTKTALNALNDVYWPGRWQIIHLEKNKLILDCAHNEAGAHALAENLQSLIQTEGKKPAILLGILGKPRAAAILPILSQYASTLILVQPNHPKATDIHTLKTLIPTTFQGQIIEGSIKDLFPSPFHLNIQTKFTSTIVATGSIYLIGEILEQLGINI